MKSSYLKLVLSILSPALVAGFVLAKGYPGSTAIFMNGRIAAPHEFIEAQCGKCHEPWQGVNNRSCLKCHVDDRHYMVKDTNGAAAEKLRCFDCHREHLGRSYDLEVAEQLCP